MVCSCPSGSTPLALPRTSALHAESLCVCCRNFFRAHLGRLLHLRLTCEPVRPAIRHGPSMKSFRQLVAVGHHARDVVWLSDGRPRHTGKSFTANSSSDTPSAGFGGVHSSRRLAGRSRHSPSNSRGHARALLFDAVDSLLSSTSDLPTSSASSASSKAAARVSSIFQA